MPTRGWSIACSRPPITASAGPGTGSTWSGSPRPRATSSTTTSLDAHRYRDYVVRALNADLPYDRLVVEHVAGDLLAPPRRHPTDGFNESILGTGFFLLGEGIHSPVDLLDDEAMRIDNQVDVLSKTFLGLTVACARCHDHKFDAISTRDYYALYGYLQQLAASARLHRPSRADRGRGRRAPRDQGRAGGRGRRL